MFCDAAGVGGNGAELAGRVDPIAAEIEAIGAEESLPGGGVFQIVEACGIDVQELIIVTIISDRRDDGIEGLSAAVGEGDGVAGNMIYTGTDLDMALTDKTDRADVENGRVTIAADRFEGTVRHSFQPEF